MKFYALILQNFLLSLVDHKYETLSLLVTFTSLLCIFLFLIRCISNKSYSLKISSIFIFEQSYHFLSIWTKLHLKDVLQLLASNQNQISMAAITTVADVLSKLLVVGITDSGQFLAP